MVDLLEFLHVQKEVYAEVYECGIKKKILRMARAGMLNLNDLLR
jgi:hypothetical protein